MSAILPRAYKTHFAGCQAWDLLSQRFEIKLIDFVWIVAASGKQVLMRNLQGKCFAELGFSIYAFRLWWNVFWLVIEVCGDLQQPCASPVNNAFLA